MFANRLKHSDGERCYERHAAYQMRWDLDALGIPDGGLSSLLSAAAPNGGPLALLGAGAGDPDSGVAAPQLRVYSASGEMIRGWPWLHGRCVGLGWSGRHELVAVLESGHALVWSMHGARLAEFGLGAACEAHGLLSAEVLPDALLLLGKDCRCYALHALGSEAERRLVPLADPRLAVQGVEAQHPARAI